MIENSRDASRRVCLSPHAKGPYSLGQWFRRVVSDLLTTKRFSD